MSPVATLETRPAHLRRRTNIAAVVAAAALLLVLVGAGFLVRTPATVDQVVLRNRTSFDLNVDVRSASSPERVLLGVAQPNSSTVVSSIPDEGDTWIFTFSRGGVVAGVERVGRSMLSSHGWQLDIPPSVTDTLTTQAQTPSPS